MYLRRLSLKARKLTWLRTLPLSWFRLGYTSGSAPTNGSEEGFTSPSVKRTRSRGQPHFRMSRRNLVQITTVNSSPTSTGRWYQNDIAARHCPASPLPKSPHCASVLPTHRCSREAHIQDSCRSHIGSWQFSWRLASLTAEPDKPCQADGAMTTVIAPDFGVAVLIP